MTDRAALAARFRHAASVWKGTCLAKVDVSAEVCDLDVIADALSTPSASAGPQAEAWCQPMDNGKHKARKFMIYFEDPDHGIMVFTDEAEARAAFEKKNAAWNCYLFGTLPLYAHPQLQQAGGHGAVIEALIQRHASAYVARGAAISDSIIAECKASREALLAALQTDGPAK